MLDLFSMSMFYIFVMPEKKIILMKLSIKFDNHIIEDMDKKHCLLKYDSTFQKLHLLCIFSNFGYFDNENIV